MFKSGNRVVCIKLDNIDIDSGESLLYNEYPKIKEIVTIIDIDSTGFLLLEEYRYGFRNGECLEVFFDYRCFRPIDESFADEIIKKITKEIEIEYLQEEFI